MEGLKGSVRDINVIFVTQIMHCNFFYLRCFFSRTKRALPLLIAQRSRSFRKVLATYSRQERCARWPIRVKAILRISQLRKAKVEGILGSVGIRLRSQGRVACEDLFSIIAATLFLANLIHFGLTVSRRLELSAFPRMVIDEILVALSRYWQTTRDSVLRLSPLPSRLFFAMFARTVE